MKYFLSFFIIFCLLENITFAEQNKLKPDYSVESILHRLDCAGARDGQGIRLTAGARDPRLGEYEVIATTQLLTFAKKFIVIGKLTSTDKYFFHGNKPEPFIISIDKLGVHGAHNASLEFILNDDTLPLECYFY